uniref:Family with sequence similarity 180 member A n=1 Tax=Poecilia latipinna TaxID=48699 RepID=A0A3B3TPV7_9TELE
MLKTNVNTRLLGKDKQWVRWKEVSYHLSVALQQLCLSKNSLSIELIHQLLHIGVELNKDNNVFLLDEELASMRKGREFLSQINDGIPRTRTSTELMMKTREAHRKTPLTRDQFENLVLSMVYSALQVGAQRNKEEREAWGGVLIQLANITTYDLRGGFLYNYA